MNWDYLQPVKIRFGKGRVSEIKDLAEAMGCKRACWQQIRFSLPMDWQDRIIGDSKGTLVGAFGKISPNPDVEEVDACAEIIRQEKIDFVVALGGGSSMDCAKAAAAAAMTGDSIRNIMERERFCQKHIFRSLQFPQQQEPAVR